MTARALLSVLIGVLVGACASSGQNSFSEPPPAHMNLLEDELLTATPAEASAEQTQALEEFLHLPEDIRAQIDRDIMPLEEAERYVALRDWAFQEFSDHYDYDPTFTSSLDELPDSRKVNCFSFSNMFVASARYAGIDAKFQLVDSPPEWDAEEDTLITTQHINVTGLLDGAAVERKRTFLSVQPEETGTRIRKPASGKAWNAYVVDLNPEIATDVFDTREISDYEALALFYSNKTVETMLDGDSQSAFGYARLAIEADGRSPAAWHNLGVLFGREDRLEEAEQAYRTALAFDPDSDSSLSNLEKIYRQQGRVAEADDLVERLRKNREKNPYFYYALGKLWMAEGNYANAAIFFEEAIDRKRNEELFYYALAEAQIELEQYDRAQRSLKYARKYARNDDLSRYDELIAQIEPYIGG